MSQSFGASNHDESPDPIVLALRKDFQQLQVENRLSSGFSMERIWNVLRPVTPATFEQLEGLLALERLADRFDALAFQGSMSLEDLARVRLSFSGGISLAVQSLANAEDLATSLESTITDLESHISTRTMRLEPFFASDFETIVQRIHFDGNAATKNLLPRTELLARRSTKTAVHDGVSDQGLSSIFPPSNQVHAEISIVSERQSGDLFQKM